MAIDNAPDSWSVRYDFATEEEALRFREAIASLISHYRHTIVFEGASAFGVDKAINNLRCAPVVPLWVNK